MTRSTFILFLFFLVLCNKSVAQTTSIQQKAVIVKRMIELNHYSPRPVDDSFSTRLFKTMINAVDSRRLLFTAPEYKTLLAHSFKLDDELQGKEWAFLDLLSSLYKKSLIRADSIISVVLQKPIDFTVSESITSSSEETYSFSGNINDLSSRWSRYFKLIALEHIYDNITDDSSGKIFSKDAVVKLEPEARTKAGNTEKRKIKKALEHDDRISNFLAEIYLNAIAESFDPHTNYFSSEGKEMFQSALSTEGLSFGLEVDENGKGNIIIDHLAPGGPAWKSGELNKGDELLQVYWEGNEPYDVSGMTLDDIYYMLELPAKDRLVLKVKKANGTTRTVALRKEKMSIDENIVRSFVLKGDKKIGYILLPGFYTEWENETGSGCANDVAKEIIKLKKENIDGLLIDVRFNGGGSIGEGLELTGIFVDEGPLAGHKDKTGKINYYKDPNRGVSYEGPLALLINGQSASASEMLAASLQDYNRAVIIGSNTYGKATVQQLFPLDTTFKADREPPDNAKEIMKITLGKFFRLDGQSPQLKGVKPDVALPDVFDGLDIGEKFSPNVLASDTIKKNSYYKPLVPLPVNELARRSAERMNSNSDFQKIKKITDALAEMHRAKLRIIPLKWDEYEKWRKLHEPDIKVISGNASGSQVNMQAENNQYDKQWIQNDEYEKEINSKWLENIAGDMYIREAFLVLSDLINLQKPSFKN